MNKYVVGVALSVFSIGSALFFFRQVEKKQFGTVIVLNGPSGSGKTSIQREFQKLMMPDLWVKTGIDNLFDNPMPDITPQNISTWQSKNPIRWVENAKDESGNTVITLFVGEQGEKVVRAMNSAIAAYARNGCNTIVDYIAYKQEWMNDLEEKLADIKTYYVAVDIPLDVLERREEARGTSPKGHARSHYDTVYGSRKYDLRVNSAEHSASEIAQEIKALIEKK
jgi:chloramphenicol 3-O-phosphotransferase